MFQAAKSTRRRIAVVGPLPPPVHGLSVVTEAMAEALASQSLVSTFNTAPPDGKPGPLRPVSRAMQLLRVWGRFVVSARRRNVETIYLAVSGGAGRIADLLWIATARSLRLRIILHHHSFAYLDRPSHLMRAIACASGPAEHVVLCHAMKRALCARYGVQAERVAVISNAAFEPSKVSPTNRCDESPRPLRVGFLSAATIAKGVDTFIDVARAGFKSGTVLDAWIAGPADPKLVPLFTQATESDIRIRFLGAIYGEEKQRFLRDIDVLLFPSRYVNEAEPVVLLEALGAGIPVVSTTRGCTAELLGCGDHSVQATSDEFASKASEALSQWARNPDLLRTARMSARRRYLELRDEGLNSLGSLLRSM